MSQHQEFTQRLQRHFDAVADQVLNQLQGGEQINLNLSAEDMLYVRLNNNRVRQNTDVQQINIELILQSRGRTVAQSRTLTGDVASDGPVLTQMLQACRAEVDVLDADPHQVPMVNHGSSAESFAGELLSCGELIDAVVGAAHDQDLAGLYAGGVMVRANRNSAGQSHWFSTESFFLDYSLYSGPRAAKGSFAGSRWDDAAWRTSLARTCDLLEKLKQPKVDVKPGQYRTYLAPRAFADLLGMLGWNALSAAALQQGRSPFKKLADKEAQLSPLLSLGENFTLGLSPRFNTRGEVSAPTVPLIEQGVLQTLLVNSRTAKEYALEPNAASDSEGPRALDVAVGDLAEADILRALGTGLYLSNLHYLNWSDPVSARVTGMTRYACFWVENGEIVGPIHDLRWDESLYDALGPKLLALTNWADIDPACDTYTTRSLGGSRTPGALIDGWTYTL